MAISSELMYTILAMDFYTRGYYSAFYSNTVKFRKVMRRV